MTRSSTDDSTVTFNCTSDGIPQPRISWRRNGQFLIINQLLRYSVVTTTTDGFRSTELPGVLQTESKLSIRNLREIDKGNFSCIAQSATTPAAALLVPFQLNIEIRKPCVIKIVHVVRIHNYHVQFVHLIIAKTIPVKIMEGVKISETDSYVIVLQVTQVLLVLFVSIITVHHCNLLSFLVFSCQTFF